jgi:hypothetical protein
MTEAPPPPTSSVAPAVTYKGWACTDRLATAEISTTAALDFTWALASSETTVQALLTLDQTKRYDLFMIATFYLQLELKRNKTKK